MNTNASDKRGPNFSQHHEMQYIILIVKRVGENETDLPSANGSTRSGEITSIMHLALYSSSLSAIVGLLWSSWVILVLCKWVEVFPYTTSLRRQKEQLMFVAIQQQLIRHNLLLQLHPLLQLK